jgi:hypothetical protein
MLYFYYESAFIKTLSIQVIPCKLLLLQEVPPEIDNFPIQNKNNPSNF